MRRERRISVFPALPVYDRIGITEEFIARVSVSATGRGFFIW
jgi:hypothetical protein